MGVERKAIASKVVKQRENRIIRDGVNMMRWLSVVLPASSLIITLLSAVCSTFEVMWEPDSGGESLRPKISDCTDKSGSPRVGEIPWAFPNDAEGHPD